MKQVAWALEPVPSHEPTHRRRAAQPVVLTLEVSDPDILAELRRHEGEDRDRSEEDGLGVATAGQEDQTGQSEDRKTFVARTDH